MEKKLRSWVIYDHPKDHPDHFIARLWKNNELKSKIDSLLIRKDQLLNDNANLRLIIHKIKDTVQEFALSGLIENYPTLSDRIEDIK